MIPADLQALFASVEACGSRVTCSPPPTDTDADFLCVIAFPSDDKHATILGVVEALDSAGFKWECGEHYQNQLDGDFMSFRRDDLNLIVTASPTFAARHRVATALCTRLNLLEKAARIALFQAVLYSNALAPIERA